MKRKVLDFQIDDEQYDSNVDAYSKVPQIADLSPALSKCQYCAYLNGSLDYKRKCLLFKSVVSHPSDKASAAGIAQTATSLRKSYIFNYSK